MVEAWTTILSWATPTALFVLLNIVIGFIAVIASRKNDADPPPPDHYHNNNNHQIHHQESPRRLVRAPSLFSRVTSFEFSNLNYSVSSHHEDENRHHYYSDDSVSHTTASATADAPEPPPIARLPSFLSRMTSFNSFYHHGSVESEMDYPPVPDQPAPIATAPSLLARIASFNRSSVNNPAESEKSKAAVAAAPSLLTRMASINFSRHRSTEPEPESEPVEAREEHVTRSVTEPIKRKKKVLPPKIKKSSSEKNTEATTLLGRNDDEVDAKADDFINRFRQQLRLQRLDSLLRYRSSAGES